VKALELVEDAAPCLSTVRSLVRLDRPADLVLCLEQISRPAKCKTMPAAATALWLESPRVLGRSRD
jgi:hypothetical protein